MAAFNSKSIFQFASKSDIIKIVLAITIVFVLLQFIRISMLLNTNEDAAFYKYLWNPLSMPSDMKTFLHQPWSLITYFFLDGSFWGIVGNMIWLWIFGTVIEDLKGPNRVFPIFFIGGIAGGILMLLFGLIKHAEPQLFTGASCSIMAVAFAALMFKPHYKFYMLFGVGIPIWVFLLLFVGLRLASVQLYNLPFLFLLLGGAAVGLMYTNVLDGFFNTCSHLYKQSGSILNNERFILHTEKQNRKRVNDTLPFKRIHTSASRIDAILDKINEKGIQSLTKEERSILDDYSSDKKES
jgi:membrane associated rhomboid family serine protease